MSRNNERTGGTSPITESSSAIASSGQGQQVAWSTPTEFVTLPSSGDFYPDGHPLSGEETVEIRFMTAKEEDILTSKSLIKKGLVLDRLIESVLVNKSLKARDLLTGDKSAILIAARITGYGNEYNTEVACPRCETTADGSFSIEEVTVIKPSEEIDGVVFTGKNTYKFEAPATRATVECHMMTGADELAIARTAAKRRQHKLPDSNLTSQLRQLIVSVNGNSEAIFVNSFVDNMPAKDSRFIRDIHNRITPTVALETDFECSNCEFEQAAQAVPLTVNFLWPDA